VPRKPKPPTPIPPTVEIRLDVSLELFNAARTRAAAEGRSTSELLRKVLAETLLPARR
jgi:hypothetical protein